MSGTVTSGRARIAQGENELAVDSEGKAAVQNPSNLDVALSAVVGEVSPTPTANTILARLKNTYDAIASRIGTLGQKAMAGSTPVVVASDQSDLDVLLKDSNGLAMDVANGASIPAAVRGLLLYAKDASSDVARRVVSTSDGRLQVSTAVAPPPNTTQVKIQATGNVTGVDDNVYIIPTGETLRIQRFSGSAEIDDSGGQKIELYYDPNGNGSGMTLLRVAYVGGNVFEYALDYTAPAVGDGTRSIRMRRERLSGGAKEVAGFWDGYY